MQILLGLCRFIVLARAMKGFTRASFLRTVSFQRSCRSAGHENIGLLRKSIIRWDLVTR
jgi:hypothetical protein